VSWSDGEGWLILVVNCWYDIFGAAAIDEDSWAFAGLVQPMGVMLMPPT
jgi:hypothetical protein